MQQHLTTEMDDVAEQAIVLSMDHQRIMNELLDELPLSEASIPSVTGDSNLPPASLPSNENLALLQGIDPVLLRLFIQAVFFRILQPT